MTSNANTSEPSSPGSFSFLRNEWLWVGSILIGLLGVLVLFPSQWVLLAILLLLLGSVIVAFGYEYLPLFLLATLPFSVEFTVSGDTRITLPTELFIPGLTLLVLAESVLFNRIRFYSSWLNLAVFSMILVMVGSMLYTQQPVSTMKALVRDLGYIFAGYYLIPRFLTSTNRVQFLLKTLLVSHVLIAAYGLGTQAVGGIRIYGDLAYPFFIEHCIYAAFICFSLVFMLAFALNEPQGRTQTILWIATAFLAFAVFLTFVRGSWISLLPVLFYYMLQFRTRRGSVDLVVVGIYVILIGIVIVLGTGLGQLFLQRIETVTDLQYVANYDRIGRWFSAIAIWQDNPIFGAGWGSYPDMYFYYIIIKDTWSGEFRMGAHNIYLELLSEVGIVGLIVFLTLIYVFFRQAILLQFRTNNSTLRTFLIATQGAMITFLVHAFLNNLGPSDKIGITFWFFLGSIPAIQSIIEKEEEGQSAR